MKHIPIIYYISKRACACSPSAALRGLGGLMLVLLLVVLPSCSTTRNLPEGEVLYTGISDISFGQKSRKVAKARKDSVGMITALNDGYETVRDVLTGQWHAGEKTLDMDNLTTFERDSLMAEKKVVDEAYATAKDEVVGALSVTPNNSLMGSTKYRFPLYVGLWMYNRYVNSTSRFGKWMFNTFASDPKLISTVNPGLRAKVARNVLHNYGYFNGDVEYDILPQKNPRKAKIAYSVYPRKLYRLDSIAIQYFPPLMDSIIHAHDSLSLLKRGNAFTAESLQAERERLNTLMRNNGFYFCQPTFFTYRADTLQRQGFVQLQVRPSLDLPITTGRRYYLRQTRLHLVDPRRGTERIDSIGRADVRMFYTAEEANAKPSLKYGVLRHYIFYRKGQLYRERMMDLVQEKLSELGVFSQVDLNFTPATQDSLLYIKLSEPKRELRLTDSLDVDITLVLDKPFDSELRASGVNKSNGLIGPALSYSITKRNAFRGAEALSFKAYGNYEWMTGNRNVEEKRLINSFEYGLSVSLDYPYIKLGRFGRKFTRRAISSTSFKLEANVMNQSGYFGRVGLATSVVVSYQSKPTVKHELTPFRLDYQLQLSSTKAFDDIMESNPALAVSMRNQFVPSLQYVLQMSTRRRARNQRKLLLTVKEAGNVISGIYACFGQRFNEQNKNLFNVPFAQYIKGVAEFTDKIPLGTGRSQLAAHVQLGAVYSYGNATNAPYNDLFSVGGANSIRAFGIRSIGPGSYVPGESNYSYVNQVGDFKFEANLEWRFPIIANLYGALFADCGNVWLLHEDPSLPGAKFQLKNFGRELALGTGLGIRYDLDFLVIRVDLGVGLHAPYNTGKAGYYNMPSFAKSLGYHLAIGYPF
ncbi:MAG: BamA/TamA family outer membrane protein [Bacteroidales bacterium]|nr:BamA/TamA family outer membrane protein [Candidatus Physcousia equi]